MESKHTMEAREVRLIVQLIAGDISMSVGTWPEQCEIAAHRAGRGQG